MTISSSLNAGVTGLFSNATKLATISDNIANSETSGYKRADADFSSVVLSSRKGSYTAGGVQAQSFRDVNLKGTPVATANATDIAVSRRGMLPVSTKVAVEAGSQPFMLTPTGSFRVDEQGYLASASGLVLLGWAADADGSIPAQARNSDAGLEPVRVATGSVSAQQTGTITLGVNLPSDDAQGPTYGTETYDLPVEYFDTLGSSQTLDVAFTPTGAADNEWEMTMADAGGTLETVTLTFDTTSGLGGAILNVAGATAYNATTGLMTVTLTSGETVSVDIGSTGASNRLSQLASEFAPIGVTKDGSPAGTLTGVEIDEGGYVNATYDTGFIRTIYQVPLVDVPNLNGLKAGAAQTYTPSVDSGQFYLWDAGAGPTGAISGYALEESTTDIAGELTQLIQTQRAYSSNAKVIQTVDEMLQETTNIKR